MKNQTVYCDACLEPIANQWMNVPYIDGSRNFHWGHCQAIFEEAVKKAQEARKSKAAA